MPGIFQFRELLSLRLPSLHPNTKDRDHKIHFNKIASELFYFYSRNIIKISAICCVYFCSLIDHEIDNVFDLQRSDLVATIESTAIAMPVIDFDRWWSARYPINRRTRLSLPAVRFADERKGKHAVYSPGLIPSGDDGTLYNDGTAVRVR